MRRQNGAFRTTSVLMYVLSIGLLSLAWAVTATAATYNFDQTDPNGRGTVTGTITITDGTFVNQAAADALNVSAYSITLTSNESPGLSLTLTPDNSTWSFHFHPALTFTLVANGSTLELRETVIGELGLCTGAALSVQSIERPLSYFWFGASDVPTGEPCIGITESITNNLALWPAQFDRFASLFNELDQRQYVAFFSIDFTGMEFVYSFPAVSLDPVDQLEDLLEQVEAITDDPALGQSLEEASLLLTDDNPHNDVAVCGKLEAFLQQVAAMQKSGRLTAEEAADLTQAAEAIKTDLSC